MAQAQRPQTQTLTLVKINGFFRIPSNLAGEIQIQLPKALAGTGLRVVMESTDHSQTVGIGVVPARDARDIYNINEIGKLFQAPKIVGGLEAAKKRRSNVDEALLIFYLNSSETERTGRPNFRPEMLTEIVQLLDRKDKLAKNMAMLNLRNDPDKDGDAYEILLKMQAKIENLYRARTAELYHADRDHVPLSEGLLAAGVPRFIHNKLTSEHLSSDFTQTILGIFWPRNAANAPSLTGAELEAGMHLEIGIFSKASGAMVNLYASRDAYVDPEQCDTALATAALVAKLEEFNYPLLSPEPIKRRNAMKYEPKQAADNGQDADIRTLIDARTYIVAGHYLKVPAGRPNRPIYRALLGMALTANMNMTVSSRVQEFCSEPTNTLPFETFDANHIDRIMTAASVMNGQDLPMEIDDDVQTAIEGVDHDQLIAIPPLLAYTWEDPAVAASAAFKDFKNSPNFEAMYPTGKINKDILPSISSSDACVKLVLGLAKNSELCGLADPVLNHLSSYTCPPVRDAACKQFQRSIEYLRSRRMITDTDSLTINDAAETTVLLQTITSNEDEGSQISSDMAALLAL